MSVPSDRQSNHDNDPRKYRFPSAVINKRNLEDIAQRLNELGGYLTGPTGSTYLQRELKRIADTLLAWCDDNQYLVVGYPPETIQQMYDRVIAEEKEGKSPNAN